MAENEDGAVLATAGLIGDLISQLKAGQLDDPGGVVSAWFEDNLEGLVGIPVVELQRWLGQLGSAAQDGVDPIAVWREYVHEMPAEQLVDFYALAARDLATHADPGIRLAGILRTAAGLAADAVPLLGIALVRVLAG